MSQREADRPVAINVDRGVGLLTIDWADGHASAFGAILLRRLCPCAHCRGEMGRPGWLDTNPVLTAEQTQLVDARLVGQYALGVAWADGHDTGYYTFESLRASCPCPVCSAAETAAGKA